MAAGADPRPEDQIASLKQERSTGRWPLIRWIHRRRPILTAVIVIAAFVLAWVTDAEPGSLLDPAGWRFWAGWILILMGIGVRVWGSGNLKKNEEITESGVYSLIRHPLYFGSLAIFLAYFLTIGDALFGFALFLLLTFAVYLPTMLAEEEHLMLKFPNRFASYTPPPRLLPALPRLGQALATDEFTPNAAVRNLGIRSLWVILVLPALLELMRVIPQP